MSSISERLHNQNQKFYGLHDIISVNVGNQKVKTTGKGGHPKIAC